MKIVRAVLVLSASVLIVLAAGCGGGGSAGSGNNPQPPTQPTPPAAPQLAITTTSLPLGMAGTPYSVQLAATNGTPPYTWSASSLGLPQGLKLSSSGLLSGTPTSSFCSPITITVRDSGSPVQSGSASFPFNDGAGYVSMTGAQVGSYFHGAIIFQCATDPVSWSLVSGSLPPGLQIKPVSGETAQLNFPGTPTQAGTFNLTVRGQDGSNRVIQESVALGVLPLPLTITDGSAMQLGAVNHAFDHAPVISGGTPPYKCVVNSGSLAAGLQLNTSTGEITGTPQTPGYYQFTLSVTDQTTPTQFSAQKSYMMLVTPSALSGRNDSLATATPIYPGTYVASLSPYTDSVGNAAPDQDYYFLTGNGGDTFTIGASNSYSDPKTGAPATASTDPAIEILDSSGVRMSACNDPISDNPPAGAPFTKGPGNYTDACVDHGAYDAGNTTNSSLTVRLPPGSNQTFYIHVFDFEGRARPDFIYTLGVTKQ